MRPPVCPDTGTQAPAQEKRIPVKVSHAILTAQMRLASSSIGLVVGCGRSRLEAIGRRARDVLEVYRSVLGAEAMFHELRRSCDAELERRDTDRRHIPQLVYAILTKTAESPKHARVEHPMKVRRTILTTTVGALVALAPGATARAAEVDVLASLAIKPVIEAVGPSFERASGHKLVTRFELTPAVKRQIEAGAAFDVAIANPPHIIDLIKQGKIVAGSRADIARFGVGVGVRTGAPKPDVSSSGAFKRTLLGAKSVAYVGEGTSGAFVRGLLDRLGIAEAMKDLLKPAGVAASLSSVASGDADIVVMPVPLILTHTGVELVGALPEELQDHIVMTAGVSATAMNSDAARAFVEFLLTTDASAVIKAKGYERPTD